MKGISKQYYIISAVVIVFVLCAIGYVMYRSRSAVPQSSEKKTVFENTPDAIPTVDSSVKVEIDGNTEATMTITGIPTGTKSIEYELNYDTKTGSIEGVFGSIEPKNGGSNAGAKLTFGTCSSGVCRYHAIVGKVRGTFKFSGTYGVRILEQSFDL